MTSSYRLFCACPALSATRSFLFPYTSLFRSRSRHRGSACSNDRTTIKMGGTPYLGISLGIFYSFDNLHTSRTLKNKLRMIATIVASPIPCSSTSPSTIDAPLTPTTSTIQVRIRFWERRSEEHTSELQ